MSFLESIKSSNANRPRRTVLYGTHGLGKSTWASKWPSPVFVPTEDGLADIDVPTFPLATTLREAWEPIIELGRGEHEFKTVVVDSADWLEKLIWQAICEKEGKKHITDFGYGKGYAEAAAKFEKYLSALSVCRNVGMHVVIIAHSQISRFESPESESFDRYTPKLHRDASALLQEWADEVLFGCYRVYVKTQSEGFGKERSIGIGAGERVLRTTEKPSHNAKNRLGLPDEMSLDFAEYEPFLKRSV